MTINQLIKALEKIQTKHGKRIRVVVDRLGVENSMPGEYSHCEVNTVDTDTIIWAINDSFELADGSERTRKVVVLCQE